VSSRQLTALPQKSAKQGPSTPANPSETDDLFLKKAWEIALAPAKAIPMNAIMMYMSGNTLQIFSIMMTVMLFMNPIKALSSVGSTFSRFDNERTHARLWPVKLAFIALQIATIALGIWKVNGMGLLPYVIHIWRATYVCLMLTAVTGLHARTGSHGKGNDNRWSTLLRPSRRFSTDMQM